MTNEEQQPDGFWIAERFCLEEVVGESTFGEVWKARDMRLDRDVAIKFLKAGSRSPKIVARFEFEQQVLARMSHPCVANVYDAGTAADGRPFLAMEYLPGSPLSSYCDEGNLSINDRLVLFVAVCRAVHHVHEHLVAHLDLKPANVLVVKRDGAAVPKVIDFGIARVADTDEFMAASGWISPMSKAALRIT